MITPKAYKKLFSFSFLEKLKGKMDEVAVIVAANNVVITDITKNGELVIKYLNTKVVSSK